MIVAAISRLAANLATEAPLIPSETWEGTTITLPGHHRWTDLLTGAPIAAKTIGVNNLFATLPVALLAAA
jgi:maltooligosyltrehalose synthase